MSKQVYFIILVCVILTASSCSTGYYGHIPRVKKARVNNTTDKPHFPIKPQQENSEELKEVEKQECIAEYQLEEVSVIIKVPNLQVNSLPKHTNTIGGEKLVKREYTQQQSNSITRSMDDGKYGYPDSSLWYFYVGVFLMVLGLIYTIKKMNLVKPNTGLILAFM